MANATNKPYAWLMPVEHKETTNNNDGELKEGSKTMRVKENDSDQTRQTFGEATFVKKSAPSFFRNLPPSPITITKNASPDKEPISNPQMDEKLPPDVVDLSLSSDEEWMNEVFNDDSEEDKDKLPDEKLGAKDDQGVTVVDERKDEKTFDEAIGEEKPVTPPPTPEELKENLSTIKEDDESDSEDDGWDDYRAARGTGSTSLVIEKPAQSVNAFGAIQVIDGSSDQNMNAVNAPPAFGKIQSTSEQEHKETSPKDDNSPKEQRKDVHPIYLDFSQDDNEKLSADENDSMKLATTQAEATASDEDDGWDDYRAMNAHTSRNISNKAKEPVNGEKMAAFGVIPEKMNECMTRNGSKGAAEISDQTPFPFGSIDTSKNTLNCSGNSPVPDMWRPLAKADNEQKGSNWAANEFFSKGDSAWNNALVREKPTNRGPWRGNYGEFVPDLPKREPIDSKRQLFHQASPNVFGLPSPQKPEKRIARESLQGFEKVLRMNKAVNSRRENKLAENAKKLFQRSKTPDFEPHLSQQYFMKPYEIKRAPYESLLSRTFTPSDVSMMPKLSAKSYGMNDRFNSSHNNKVHYPMNFDPRRAQSVITTGKLATSEMQEVAPSSRTHRIIEGTRRLFNNKEIRDFVRMTDQQTYYTLAEDLAFF